MPDTSVHIAPRPLHTKEAAAWLGISTRTLLKFARAGLIRARKVSGTWLFSVDALEDFAGVSDPGLRK